MDIKGTLNVEGSITTASGSVVVPPALTIAHTGTSTNPIVFHYGASGVIPASTSGGTASYPETSDVSLAHIGLTDSGITSIELSNLKYAGIFYSGMPACTSVSLPVLAYASQFEIRGEELTSLSVPQLKAIGGDLTFLNAPSMTSLSFPALETVGAMSLTPGGSVISSYSFPSLKNMAGTLSITNTTVTTLDFPLLETMGTMSVTHGGTTFSFPSLTTCGSFSSSSSLVTSLSLPALTKCGTWSSNFTSLTSMSVPNLATVDGGFGPNVEPVLTSMSFPALTTVNGNFGIGTHVLLNSVNFSSLTTITGSLNQGSALAQMTTWNLPALATVSGGITFTVGALLTTLNIPALISACTVTGTAANIQNISFSTASGGLTNVTFGTVGITKNLNGAAIITFAGQKMNQASVDRILAVIASLDGTNGTTSWGTGHSLVLTGGTNSTPSATGLANKAIIQARGATVTNN